MSVMVALVEERSPNPRPPFVFPRRWFPCLCPLLWKNQFFVDLLGSGLAIFESVESAASCAAARRDAGVFVDLREELVFLTLG